MSVPPCFGYLEMLLINCQSSISFSIVPAHARPLSGVRSGYKPLPLGGMDKLGLSMFYHSHQRVNLNKHG
ncbi:MAG: hypothetical protein HRU72_03955 [Planctomycetia bacterium]|nr:MAG: hypothetical protein HRU72_03955 [Planctomycetia bacterium]